MTASRIYPGSTVTLQTVVTIGGTAENAPEITFNYCIDSGKKRSVTPVNTATGTYTATITLPTDEHGLLRYRWDTEGARDFAEEGVLLIEPTAFNVRTTRDYT